MSEPPRMVTFTEWDLALLERAERAEKKAGALKAQVAALAEALLEIWTPAFVGEDSEFVLLAFKRDTYLRIKSMANRAIHFRQVEP